MITLEQDTAENRLKKTVFIVEATNFEQLALWREYAHNAPNTRIKRFQWEQINPGWLIEVGRDNNRPCCISTSWVRIDGLLVMFWYNCSNIINQEKTEKWLNKNFKGKWDNGTRRAECNAMNFGHCIDAIEEING